MSSLPCDELDVRLSQGYDLSSVMRTRDTVFGSGPERLLYKALDSAWPGRISLYPNLPFLNIVQLTQAELTEGEWNYVKSTSVDYTACSSEDDRPLLSVEFDGLGHGYSRNGQYIEWIGGSDPYRSLKMNLKLRLADRVGYPLFVVSYEEAHPIASGDQLTVTHSIVGQCLARLHFQEAAERRLEEERSLLDELPPWERDEVVRETVLDVETDLDFEWDPLLAVLSKTSYEVYLAGFDGVRRHEYLDEPGVPQTTSLLDIDGLLRRVDALKKVHRVGSRVTLEMGGQSIKRDVWVRNIDGHGVSPLGIAENLAELLAYRALLQRSAKVGSP